MAPLIVLHVIDSLSTGGAEHQLAGLLAHADRRRFRHVVCSLGRTARFAEVLRASGIPLYSLGLKPSLDLLRGVWRLRRLVHDVNPAILHATLFRAAIISRTVGTLSRRPVVTSLVSPTYEAAWRSDNRHLRPGKVAAVQFIDSLTARAWGTQFIAITHAVKSSAVLQLRIPEDRIVVIPRGLTFDAAPAPSSDEIAAARAVLGPPDAFPVILNVGRLVPPKGQRYAIAAMPQVLAAYPRARLAIVGEGWLRRDLDASIREYGLEKHVVLLGERHDVDILHLAADLFVFPSLSEGLGVSLLEALGAGRACVASRIPALVEVTDNGRVALLADPGSPESIADALIRLAGDRELAARLGREAAALARDRYNIVSSMRKTEELYASLINAQAVYAREVRVGS